MKFRLLTLLGAVAALSGAALASAEDEIGQAVYQDGPGIATPVKGDITLDQRKALYPPRGPRPGVYRMRALHSGGCLIWYDPGHGAKGPIWLNQYNCAVIDASPASASNYFEFNFVPHPAGGYTIRSQVAAQGGREPVPGQVSNCLTVAPGVVFGPARMEIRGCEIPNGQGWEHAGGDGQRFLVLKMTSDAWEIRLFNGNPESPDCVAARGGGGLGTDYIKWGCNGNADQRFMLQWVKPIPADVETATLARSKWFSFADGHYRLSPANGVDLTGANYSSFETINDNGEYCMRRCAELADCKAWTWTGPGYIGNDPPKCYWKHAAGNPVNRGPRALGKLFSGIVRQ